jgi:hypothetical protein
LIRAKVAALKATDPPVGAPCPSAI